MLGGLLRIVILREIDVAPDPKTEGQARQGVKAKRDDEKTTNTATFVLSSSD